MLARSAPSVTAKPMTTKLQSLSGGIRSLQHCCISARSVLAMPSNGLLAVSAARVGLSSLAVASYGGEKARTDLLMLFLKCLELVMSKTENNMRPGMSDGAASDLTFLARIQTKRGSEAVAFAMDQLPSVVVARPRTYRFQGFSASSYSG